MATLSYLGIREYLMKNCGFKEFSKLQWYAYAGAECFEDGSEPIIKKEEDFDVIFDRNGFSFESEDKSFTFSKDEGQVDSEGVQFESAEDLVNI